MLVYVNNFRLIGRDSFNSLLEQIALWLSDKSKKKITTDFLKSGKELNLKNPKMIIRTYTSNNSECPMYSILVSHPDRAVSGRQWIIEIGIKKEKDHTFISILLETGDVSTRVRANPPTTKPKLVNLLYQTKLLSEDTIGLSTLDIDNDKSSFSQLKEKIENKKREYPIVLVGSEKPCIDLNLLQTQLLGLAQVYVIGEDVNYYELENTLTKGYSVQKGDVRIIYPIKYDRTTLLKSNEIKVLEKTNRKLSQEILSYITHTTNGIKKKEHFSPTDLRAERYRLQRDNIKKSVLDSSSYEQLLDEQEQLIKDLQEKLKKKDNENLELEIRIEEKDKDIRDLEYKLELSKKNTKLDVSGKPLLFYGKEKDLYQHEIKELILKIVSNHFNGCDLNSNSRKNVILKDLLNANPTTNQAQNLKQQCNLIFASYEKVTPKLEKQLRDIGLIIKQTQNHNELKFSNDDRFKITFSKSPSDKIRAGEKISINIDNEFFY